MDTLRLDKELWSAERIERRVVRGLGPAATNFAVLACDSEIIDFTTGMRDVNLFCSLADCSESEAERQRSVQSRSCGVRR
jgi:hypothetical protein